MRIADSTEVTIFRNVVKGRNFMTPYVEEYYRCGDYVCELAIGRGFHNESIYGVTVLDVASRKKRSDLSCGGFDRSRAMEVMQELEEGE